MPKTYYYGERISPNITKTPQGYIIALGVPIARTGDQTYTARELEIDRSDKPITVHRPENEVFDPATLASFESMPITDEHPYDTLVNADDVAHYQKGHARNIRRGEGADKNKILADLFITDKELGAKVIHNEKRGVSCGYEWLPVPNGDGTYTSTKMRGCHVAIVARPRGGQSLSIRDSANEDIPLANIKYSDKEEQMSKTAKRKGILKLFGRVAKDAKPEELDDIVEETTDALGELEEGENKKEIPPPEKPIAKDGDDDGAQDMVLTAAIKELIPLIKELNANICAKPAADDKPPVEPKNQTEEIDNLIAELTKKGDKSAADNDESEIVEESKESDDNPTKATTPASTDAIAKILKDARPAIAKITDSAQRKAVIDSLIGASKSQLSIGASISDALAAKAQKAITDSKTVNALETQSEYDRRNPQASGYKPAAK